MKKNINYSSLCSVIIIALILLFIVSMIISSSGFHIHSQLLFLSKISIIHKCVIGITAVIVILIVYFMTEGSEELLLEIEQNKLNSTLDRLKSNGLEQEVGNNYYNKILNKVVLLKEYSVKNQGRKLHIKGIRYSGKLNGNYHYVLNNYITDKQLSTICNSFDTEQYEVDFVWKSIFVSETGSGLTISIGYRPEW